MTTIHKLSMICVASASLLWAAVPLHAEPEPEEEKTFLESHLDGALTDAEQELAKTLPDGHLLPKPITLNANWSWQTLPGRPMAYEITVSASNWKLAYLCVDGRLIKIIKPSKNQFKWSFHTLDAGEHTVELLIVGLDGQRGFLEKEIIR